MIRNAKKVIVVTDSKKMGQTSSALICPISAIHALVTDTDPPKDIHEALITRGIEVILA